MRVNPAPLSATVRKQRQRWRQRNRLVAASVLLDPSAVDALVRLGWLSRVDRADRDALAAALSGIASAAIKRDVTRWSA